MAFHGSDNASLGAGLATTVSNPVFKVSLPSLQNAERVEEKPYYTKPNIKPNQFNFKIGDTITGLSIDTNKKYIGNIIEIFKNKNYIIITDKETKKPIKLDITTCEYLANDTTSDESDELKQRIGLSFESKYIPTFENFIQQKSI